MAVLTMNVRKK